MVSEANKTYVVEFKGLSGLWVEAEHDGSGDRLRFASQSAAIAACDEQRARYGSLTFRVRCVDDPVKLAAPAPKLPTPAADADRKAIPVWTGCVRYFPSALLEVAKVSKAGNDQHNPGQPLHWAQGKSMNQTDTCMRHQLDADACEGTPEEIPHLAQAAWRLLARLQLACQREGAPLAPGARAPETKP